MAEFIHKPGTGSLLQTQKRNLISLHTLQGSLSLKEITRQEILFNLVGGHVLLLMVSLSHWLRILIDLIILDKCSNHIQEKSIHTMMMTFHFNGCA
jgi:hypothetical protein